jgi:hypothetical protein
MNVPCKIKALKDRYGSNLEMKAGSYAQVTLEHDKNHNFTYRFLRVTAETSQGFFTEKALENAIERGDFALV